MEGFQPWIEYTRFLIALTAVIDLFFAVTVFLETTANQAKLSGDTLRVSYL
jgi:hypothetical protein